MISRRDGSARRHVGLVTTTAVSLIAAAAVGWAAAVPIGGAASTAGSANNGSGLRTSQQIDAARLNLQQVQRDLSLMLTREDDLPKAKVANLSALLAQLPSVQVPQSQSATTYVSPPVTHTTTGASGAP